MSNKVKRKDKKFISELLRGELLSVIIPTYNREATITDTLLSVINQTFLPNEIIVVDDGSTDKTVEVVHSIAQQYSFVKIICYCQNNAGAQRARNKGIEISVGDWIAFLDSDDLWLPDKLELQAKVLKNVNYDKNIVVHGNGLIRTVKTGESRIWNLPITDGENVYPQLLERAAPMFQAILTSKKALLDVGMLDENVLAYQEWETSIKLSRKCRFIHIDKPLFEYLVHDTIFRNPQRGLAGYTYIVKKYEDDIIELCGMDVWCTHIWHIVNKCVIVGDYAKGYDYAKKIPDSFRVHRYLLYFFVSLRGKGAWGFRFYDVYKTYSILGIIRKIFKKVWTVWLLKK